MTCVGLYDCIWFDRVKVTDKFNGRVSNLSVYASMVTFIWTYGVTTRERREREVIFGPFPGGLMGTIPS